MILVQIFFFLVLKACIEFFRTPFFFFEKVETLSKWFLLSAPPWMQLLFNLGVASSPLYVLMLYNFNVTYTLSGFFWNDHCILSPEHFLLYHFVGARMPLYIVIVGFAWRQTSMINIIHAYSIFFLLLFWVQGWSFSDVMFVTKRNMANAVANVSKQLEQVSTALAVWFKATYN